MKPAPYTHVARRDWQHPLEALRRCESTRQCALLYSGQSEAHTGRYSFLGVKAAKVASGSLFSALPATPETEDALPYWIGFLGYAMRHDAEHGFKAGERSPIYTPDFLFTHYENLWRFDHHEQCIDHYVSMGAQPFLLSESREPIQESSVSIRELHSNFSRQEYEQAIADTIAQIEAGAFYQANITRKFWGETGVALNPVDRYVALCTRSPAPYSAFMRMGDIAILSSSPECFLTVEKDGTVSARPIKGSAKREENAEMDAATIAQLTSSTKDLAENLMIVDLMRHDLAHVCAPGSVRVTEHAQLYSYATIHHLVSTIKGRRSAEVSLPDILRATFPAGSMTGAPKIAAIRWCEQQERLERGLYSGAIGWLGSQNTADFSVVIRTLLLQGARFEFQVGGGIVADSTPRGEWSEALDKARAIADILGISRAELEAI
jgi:anthranilate/para-aminobenzoate synthase component I